MRHIAITTIKNLVIGKTAMTATSRASIIVGVCTGSAWLYNSSFDHQRLFFYAFFKTKWALNPHGMRVNWSDWLESK